VRTWQLLVGRFQTHQPCIPRSELVCTWFSLYDRDPRDDGRAGMTSKLLPLSGAAAVVLIVASFATAGSVPKQDAPTSEVVSFYADHDTGQLVSASVLSLGALLFLVFVAR